jgi:transcriptional regulator NrdR family protein
MVAARKPAHALGDGRGCVCPACEGSVSSVTETRSHGGKVFRRRQCRCGFAYTTVEEVIDRSIREMIKPLTYKKVRSSK